VGYHPRKKIVTSHQAKRWSHQPKNRRGVAYSNRSVKQKYYGNSAQNNKNVRRNNKVVFGSSYRIKPYKSTQQVNQYKDFNKKLKVKSHQQSKPYSKQVRHKISKNNTKKHTDNSSFKKQKNYTNNSKNIGKSTYKIHKSKSIPVTSKANRTKAHQPNKHNVLSRRSSIKKNSVHSSTKHNEK
jgi:hypothetical protein